MILKLLGKKLKALQQFLLYQLRGFLRKGETTKTPRKKTPNNNSLASWWLNHPFEKYARQIGSFPQGSGMKIAKNLWIHQPARDPWDCYIYLAPFCWFFMGFHVESKSTHHLEVAYVVFPSLPVKYRLRLGFFVLCFWGPNTSSPGVWKPRVCWNKTTLPKSPAKSIAESTLQLPHQPWNWKWRNDTLVGGFNPFFK